MPTFNQLVRKGRKVSTKKSNSPALQYTYNSLNKKTVAQSSPQTVSYTHLIKCTLEIPRLKITGVHETGKEQNHEKNWIFDKWWRLPELECNNEGCCQDII